MAEHWDHWEAARFIGYGDPSAEANEQWRDRELRRRDIDPDSKKAKARRNKADPGLFPTWFCCGSSARA